MNRLGVSVRTIIKTYRTGVQRVGIRSKTNFAMNGVMGGFVTRDNGKVISISNRNAVQLAASMLESGSVIALPTDTVYGLACSANNPEAIQKLYDVKGRHELKPVAICVPEVDDLRRWGDADHISTELLQQLLPGPVTIVVRRSKQLNNPYLNPGTSKIGIRIPDFEFIRELSRKFPLPIALTSANKSASGSTLSIHEFKCLWPSLGAVFDGGRLGLSDNQRAASTVIDLSEEGSYSIIRSGVAAKHTVRIVEQFNFLPKTLEENDFK